MVTLSSILKLLLAVAILYGILLLATLLVRTSPRVLLSGVSVRVAGEPISFYFKLPYGSYNFSYGEAPKFSIVKKVDPPKEGEDVFRTVLERNGAIMFDTVASDFSWTDKTGEMEAIKITCTPIQQNGSAFLNITPGF